MAIGRRGVAGLLALAVSAAAPSAWAQKPIPEAVRMMEPHRLRIGDYVRAWPNEGGPPVSGTVARTHRRPICMHTVALPPSDMR